VTSDNPRNEGTRRSPAKSSAAFARDWHRRYAVELDRATAIATAIAEGQAGTVVLLAGKGHETYQERAGVRHPFSDADHAVRALAARSQR
jgi:UDP-N-acetylmuramoyl-L-alanyl-D-glutamate--2,6-diaminopimelate ligase